ncbi:cytochrome c oxidase subunit 3 family protein [Bacteroidota bacterium]
MNVHRDDAASKMGMWIFLFTELLLFGGLFLVYSIYRLKNPHTFAHAGEELDVFIGTINTIVLITSSLTVALSITAIQKNKPKLAIGLLVLTIVFALVFMINKYFEWGHKIEHGLFPGQAHYMSLEPGEKLFFYLYYFMTGLHGLHVIVGSILLGFVILRIRQGRVTHDNFVFHENGGLYWHLVDLIWIYLFPLFYLIH